MLELFIAAVGMSLIFAAQPGVIMFEAIRRGIPGGWRTVLAVEFGSLVGDFTWATLALIGASLIFQQAIFSILLGIFGALFLLYLSWDAWQDSHKTISLQSYETETIRRNNFMAGVLLSVSNPGNVTFWLGMSGVVVGLGFLNPQPIHLVVFLAGFMFAQFCWCFVMAALITFGRRFITPQLFRWINRISAVLLAYMGATLLHDTLQLWYRSSMTG